MIKRSNGEVRMTCDTPGCHQTVGNSARDFYTMLDMAKMLGWRIRDHFKDGRWENTCPQCVEHGED
jgi:hypothetical protein